MVMFLTLFSHRAWIAPPSWKKKRRKKDKQTETNKQKQKKKLKTKPEVV